VKPLVSGPFVASVVDALVGLVVVEQIVSAVASSVVFVVNPVVCVVRLFVDVEPTYQIVEGGKAIKCLRCEMTSWHPEDVRHRYCGNCNVFHEDLMLQERLTGRTVPTHPRLRGPSDT
jgi:hypothetical protein